MSYHDGDREMWWALKWLIVFAVVVGLLGLAGWGLSIALRPAQLDAEAEANRDSHQYVESQVEFLQQKHQAYLELEDEILELEAAEGNDDMIQGKRSQQRAFLIEMHDRAGRLDEGEIPEEIAEFLAENPRPTGS